MCQVCPIRACATFLYPSRTAALQVRSFEGFENFIFRNKDGKESVNFFWVVAHHAICGTWSFLVRFGGVSIDVYSKRCVGFFVRRIRLVGGALGAGRKLRCRELARVRASSSMAPPMLADVGLPSAGRVLSIQSHTVHVSRRLCFL